MKGRATRHFDVVVAGAGSAGCAAARRLVDAGHRVCLLEAGPDYGPYQAGGWPADILDASADAVESHDWGFPGGPASSRARIVGGCSAHNGCGIVWPARADIDDWGAAGHAGWSFAALEPYLLDAQRTLRTRPSEARDLEPWRSVFLEAALERGFPLVDDLNHESVVDGIGLVPVNAAGAVRWNAAFAYLDPIRESKRLTLVDQALVDRVLFDQDRATAVVARTSGGEVAFSADRIVLAAGAYGSPAILQRSGIGAPEPLRALGIRPAVDLPAVGRNLQDHPTVDLPFAPSVELSALTAAHQAIAGPAAQCLLKARTSLAKGSSWDLMLGPWTARRADGQVDYAGILVTVSLPRSRGSVSLRSADPAVLPAVSHGFLSDADGHDLAVALEGVTLAAALAATRSGRRLLADSEPLLPAGRTLAAWVRDSVSGNYHPCSTCAMGPPNGGVVDARGRVHHVENLYVVDASVLPTIPRANIHLTVVAVAERLAGGIAGQDASPAKG
jgi:choline dehydrogenase